MNKLNKDLIYLLSCAVNGITPDTARVQAMDMDELYDFCKSYTLRGAVYIALKSAGVTNEAFDQAYNKAVRKNVLFDIERKAILAEFEKRGIWYMPLKGAILKDIYPENGMREMSDNDILYDVDHRKVTKEIMTERGYKVKHFGSGNCDEYLKPPIYNYELHNSFFNPTLPITVKLYDYYKNIKQRLIKDSDKEYGYHFSDEDFYLYMLAHEYKHFSDGGTGIRSLLDCYVFLNNKRDTLNWKYIEKETEQLGIDAFERSRRKLAMEVFSSDKFPELTDIETELLETYLHYGTYGTIEHSAENRVKINASKLNSSSKAEYIRKRIFADENHMKTHFPFFYKHRILIPFAYIWRIIRFPFVRGKQVKAEIKVLNKYDNKKV